jgi:multiple antibiotic resistance protein
MPDIPDILKALVAIVVLINPFEGIPLFLAKTAAMDRGARVAVALKASLTVAALLIGALFCGKAILYWFGIEIATFTVAGGLIILLIALKMVLGPVKADDSGPESGDISIVPLGTPLLAGPGPISSVIVYSGKGISGAGPMWVSDLILLGIIVLAALITYGSLRLALPVGRSLGPTGINVLTRLAGILVTAIALQMVLGGLAATFPAWK